MALIETYLIVSSFILMAVIWMLTVADHFS